MKTLQFKTLIIIALIATLFSSCTKSSDIEYPTLKQVYFSETFDNTGGTALPNGLTTSTLAHNSNADNNILTFFEKVTI